jgi:Rieske 2Fe-2S family protein
MNHPAHAARASHEARVRLVRRLLAQKEGAAPFGARVGEVPASRYTSDERFLAEQRAVFARLPALVAHESELAEPGSCLTVDVAGVPLLITRAEDGSLGAFKNACRHRSTQLLGAQGALCNKKAIVCPYHGWTYDLHGRLIHVPHEEAFRGAPRVAPGSREGLRAAHVENHLGFVWAGLAPFDMAEHVAPIAPDLAALGAAGSVVYRRSTREVRGNWKLVIDAFLDGYHIRHLHRETVYRFFVDSLSEAEPAGPHIRAVTARRSLLEAGPASIEDAARDANQDLRQLVTPSYLVFPSTILVLHPDYTSVLTAAPLSACRTRFQHTMLIPKAPTSESQAEHWAKSFTLIDEGVFLREDLATVEAMQRGIESGANETLLFGALEHVALWFHESVDAALAGAAPCDA